MNDFNTYPLDLKNSRLWRDYYNARLAHLGGRMLEAENVYKSLSQIDGIELKLQAYALCDWGTTLRGRRIGQPEIVKQAIVCFEGSLATGGLDYKVAIGLLELGLIYRDLGDWERAFSYLGRALTFYLEHNARHDMALTYLRYRWLYAYRGDWKQMLTIQTRVLDLIHELNDPLRLRLESGLVVAWLWLGRYAETERSYQEKFQIKRTIGWSPTFFELRDLALAYGFSGKFDEALHYFYTALEESQQLRKYTPREEGVTLGFYGATLVRKGELDKAVEVLSRSLDIKQGIHDTSYLLDTVNWLGIANEISRNWTEAEKSYNHNLSEYQWIGHLYFACGAHAGLVRVKHAQNDYAAILPHLAEAEQLAQQYEYNDHLTSLRLTQGHVAWEGKAPTWENGFEAALHFYQHALIYALRYNRFLLDEALSGRPQGSPLQPIISHCRERGEEGRRMLIALRDWWKAGVNDIGTLRPDTISPIPEGIPLLKAEHIAREREPGDGTSQKSVVEQIEAALSSQGTG